MSADDNGYAMPSAQGASVAIQVRSLIDSLADTGERASITGDNTVIELLHHLHAAWRTARIIEDRSMIKPSYLGVRMTREPEDQPHG